MIRVVTYNLSGGLDIGALAEVLASLEPDVVCAVEAPARMGLRRLARRADLDVAIRAGRRRLGVALLTGERARVLSAVAHDLTPVEGLPHRAVAQAIVGVGSLRLGVFAVQFGLRPEVRAVHVGAVEQLAAKVNAPVVIGGDLNEAPGGPTVGRLAEILVDAFETAGEGLGATYPNPEPMSRKDYVFVDRSLAVVRAFVPADGLVAVASHHRPVVAELAAVEEVGEPARASEARDPAAREPAA